jgi:hypothetical protein
VRGLIVGACATWSAVMMTGCRSATFAVPVQRQPLEDYRPYGATRVVRMIDSDAEVHFVRDITGGPVSAAPWRWTGKKPTIRVHPSVNQGLEYVAEFGVPEVTFKDTGPVTLSFYIGEHLLDRVRYEEPGSKEFRKAVPAEWIAPGRELLLSAEIDKVWISKDDGATLGFLLSSLGLEQAKR